MKLTLNHFKAGSYITVEDKLEGDHFYILRHGSVKIFSSFRTGYFSERILKPGDFFAVISSMTGHPRLVSSQALVDSSVIIVRQHQFSFLIQQSSPLALKIIRSFSNELRKHDEMLTEKTLLVKKKNENPYMLYHHGEFYFNKGEHAIAAYIYTQYIKNFAYSELAMQAQQKLKQIDPAILTRLGKLFSSDLSRHYDEGDILFSEFEPGFEAFIIEKGRIKISKVVDDKEILIAVLKRGDIFGEMALLNNENRSASAIAMEPAVCTVLNQHNFNNIIKKNAKLAVRIITLLSERLWTIYKQLDNFYFSDVKSRIYNTLVTQARKKHLDFSVNKAYTFDIGISEIKSMLGVEEDAIDKAMQVILTEDIIDVRDNKFFCKDLGQLEKEVLFARKMEQRRRKIVSSRNT